MLIRALNNPNLPFAQKRDHVNLYFDQFKLDTLNGSDEALKAQLNDNTRNIFSDYKQITDLTTTFEALITKYEEFATEQAAPEADLIAAYIAEVKSLLNSLMLIYSNYVIKINAFDLVHLNGDFTNPSRCVNLAYSMLLVVEGNS